MKSGKVQTVRSGNRIFVNLDSLIEYLVQNPVLDLSENKKIEGIRPVPEVIRPAKFCQEEKANIVSSWKAAHLFKPLCVSK